MQINSSISNKKTKTKTKTAASLPWAAWPLHGGLPSSCWAVAARGRPLPPACWPRGAWAACWVKRLLRASRLAWPLLQRSGTPVGRRRRLLRRALRRRQRADAQSTRAHALIRMPRACSVAPSSPINTSEGKRKKEPPYPTIRTIKSTKIHHHT